MDDPTEDIRRAQQLVVNALATERQPLEEKYGQVWDTQELSADFEVLGFLAPYIVVKRKSDNKRGSLMFQHSPRYYFNWQEEK